MKLLVGIDSEEKFQKAVTLLRRLDFQGADWHLAHIRPPFDPNPLKVKLGENDSSASAYKDDLSLLHELSDDLKSSGSSVSSHVFDGFAADQLLRLSDELDADVLAVGSEAHGRLGALLTGSVGRAVALGDRTFLIARGEVKAGPVKAIFATDFSAYARRALDLLLQMKPKGLKEVVVVTAADMLELSEMDQYMNLLDDADIEGLTFDQILQMHGGKAVARLKEAGIQATSELRHGFVGHVIEESVKEHNADLIIMGAQGHGFFERLMIGSVALDQVVGGRSNLLVMRSRPGSSS